MITTSYLGLFLMNTVKNRVESVTFLHKLILTKFSGHLEIVLLLVLFSVPVRSDDRLLHMECVFKISYGSRMPDLE